MSEPEHEFVICPICGDRVLEGHTNLRGVCPDCEDEETVKEQLHGK